jgi:hypothetical protein
MHIGHRLSEDLDFAIAAPRLPRLALDGLIRILQVQGWSVARNDAEASYDEFLNAGMSLHDYQQDFLVNGVKLTFFTADADLAAAIEATAHPTPRVASLPELFRTKVISASNRRASRDWLDLYILLTKHSFTLEDFVAVFQRDGINGGEAKLSQAFRNLCGGKTNPSDPGYSSLLKHPPKLEEIADFFSDLQSRYEVETSRKRFLHP